MSEPNISESDFTLQAVVAGRYGPQGKQCFYVIGTYKDMWGMNVIPIESCSRILRRLWAVSESLSTAMIPLLRMFYEPAHKPPEEAESLQQGMKVLRVGGVDVLHYADTKSARQVMPIIRQLLLEDPDAVGEILTRVANTPQSERQGGRGDDQR